MTRIECIIPPKRFEELSRAMPMNPHLEVYMPPHRDPELGGAHRVDIQ